MGDVPLPSTFVGVVLTVPLPIIWGCSSYSVLLPIIWGCGSNSVPLPIIWGCGSNSVPLPIIWGCSSNSVPLPIQLAIVVVNTVIVIRLLLRRGSRAQGYASFPEGSSVQQDGPSVS